MTSRKYREYLYCPLTQVITLDILAKAKESENFSNFQKSLIENDVLGCAYYLIDLYQYC